MKVMIVGDIHGNIKWLRSYVYPVALTLGADAIVQCGDFGAWEHTVGGVRFMNQVGELASLTGIPMYWLFGNHDKVSHTLAMYGRDRDSQGFVVCRENVFHIPQGLSWTWDKVVFRAFGGAYSIDKDWRIRQERAKQHALELAARRSVGSGNLFGSETVVSQAGTLWFPEEEMTDAEMNELLTEDATKKDIILSHDKPYSANPGWNRPSYPACVPNQLRMEAAMRVHRPEWWFHGHLHYYYLNPVHGQGWTAMVVGLDTDIDAAESGLWAPERTWALVNCQQGAQTGVRLGIEMELNESEVTERKLQLREQLG